MTAGPVVAAEDRSDLVAERVPGSGRLEALDGYRALAAVLVLLTHVGFQTGVALRGPYAGVLARFDIGVTIFFLLSGFLLTRPFFVAHHRGSAPQPVRVYAWHRALRILPAYWCAVVAAMLVFPANQGSSPAEWLVQLLVLQTYVPDSLLPGLTQMWSLGAEIGFYVALPLLGRWVLRRRSDDPSARAARQWRLVIALVVAAQLWRAYAYTRPDGPGLLPLWLPNYLDWFGLGMALAVLRSGQRDAGGRLSRWFTGLASAPGVCWTFALSAFWISTTSIGGPLDLTTPTLSQAFLKHWLYGAAAFFALLPVAVGHGDDRMTAAWASRVPSWLGEVSYGIFLWNVTALYVVFRITGIPTFHDYFWPVLVLVLALTVSVAAVSWYVVERPALRLRRFVR
ncbi:MAG TPA: acyltransferase [Candidatus Nanopelagicales bacterium]|nr:acyltransferase [Candidatus Nanopelagicales bacterium]